MGIAATHPGLVGAGCGAIEMHDLSECMDTGVGTSGAIDTHGLPGHAGECQFQHILYGQAVWLRLPAMKSGTVVFDAKCDAGHEAQYRGWGRIRC